MESAHLFFPVLGFFIAIALWRRLLPYARFRGIWFADWLEERGLWRHAQVSLGWAFALGALLGIGFSSTIQSVAGIEPQAALFPSILGHIVMTGFLVCASVLRVMKRGTRATPSAQAKA